VFDSDDGGVYDVWVSSKDSFKLSRRNLPAAHYDLVSQLLLSKTEGWFTLDEILANALSIHTEGLPKIVGGVPYLLPVDDEYPALLVDCSNVTSFEPSVYE
jgi:hypothetical protein